MKRTVLEFSVRTCDPRPLNELSQLVEAALGCSFHDGEFRKTPAKVAVLLGMEVGLYGWRGRDDKAIYRLQADVTDARFVQTADDDMLEIEGVDISQAVIDGLAVYGAGEWYVPSPADLDAEAAYGYELERSLQVTDEQIRRWESGG